MPRRRRIPKLRGGPSIERLNAMMLFRGEPGPAEGREQYAALWEELRGEMLAQWEPETIWAWWWFDRGQEPPESLTRRDPRLDILDAET